MPEIEREVTVFFHAFLMGIIIAAGLFFCEVLKHLFSHKKWMVHMEDILYWGSVSIYLFVQIYHTNNGKIRWFNTLGIVLGAFFLWKTLTNVLKIMKKIYIYIRRKFHKSP